MIKTDREGIEKLEAYSCCRILSTPMKRILIATGLQFLVVITAVFGSTQSSSAQDLNSRFSRQTAQSVIAADPVPPAPGTPEPSITPAGQEPSITPAGGQGTSITPSGKAKQSGNYGIVRSVSSGTLEIRSLDGTTKQITVPENLATSASGLKRGSLVGYDTDASGALTKLQPPAVDRTLSGTVSEIKGNQVTIKSATGESVTTPVDPATISRMGLNTGSQLTVTTFKDTWATKVCGAVTPAPAPVTETPVAPTPVPTGGAVSPPPPKPVKGLW
jgi:hypothetical protein